MEDIVCTLVLHVVVGTSHLVDILGIPVVEVVKVVVAVGKLMVVVGYIRNTPVHTVVMAEEGEVVGDWIGDS